MKKFLGVFMVLGLAFMFTCQEARADSPVIYNPDNGHYYQRIDMLETWDNAQAYLQTLYPVQGYLATLTSALEDAFVYSAVEVGVNNTWLGGHDTVTEGTWQWVTGEAWSYTNWALLPAPQPDDGAGWGQEYLVYWASSPSFWDDQGTPGETTRAFIGEWDSNPVPEPATLLLLGSGLVGLFGFGRKKEKELV